MVRVRFAPSPTGSLHLGNALSAAANRRFADEHGGRLLLRIDDTDPSRNAEGGAEAIVADLEWLGLAWDDGPLRQSERHVRHREAAHLIGEPDADGALRHGRTTLL
ncbi:MAG: glutamate--tRNA ligase family protein, partial [Gaiellaceae bacterium]